jgi:hypothetical protein
MDKYNPLKKYNPFKPKPWEVKSYRIDDIIDYDNINKTNFPTIIPVTSFTINVATSNVIQNIKYCILGDINLSHSSN